MTLYFGPKITQSEHYLETPTIWSYDPHFKFEPLILLHLWEHNGQSSLNYFLAGTAKSHSGFLGSLWVNQDQSDLAIYQSKSDSHQEHDYLQHWWYDNNEKIFIHIIKWYDIRQYQALRVLKLDYKQPTQFHLPSHGKQTLQEPAHDQEPLISKCTMKANES